MAAEGIRRLRTKSIHSGKKKALQSILITSTSAGEGKTLISASLGVALAQGIDQYALLVDCDLRRPTLANLFGLGNDKGLSNFLINGTDLSELIKKTSQDKLSLIPSGTPPPNPAELLDSDRMKSMIQELSRRYPDRLVIFDSPPIEVAAETQVLAKHVDGIVLVVRWGKSSRQLTQKAINAIGKEKIIGIVFNAFEVNGIESRLAQIKGYDSAYKYGQGY